MTFLHPAEFEAFCCDLLARAHPEFGPLRSNLSAKGKTTKGTPDAHAELGGGKYVACQFTMEGRASKIEADLQKLADRVRCPISDDITQVVVCLASPLRAPLAPFNAIADNHGWSLTIYDQEALAALGALHPDLCEAHFDPAVFVSEWNDAAEESQEGRDGVAKAREEIILRCGSRIRAARRDTGLSQSEFVELIGFPSESRYDHIERGKEECPVSLVERTSEITGINAEWLKHGTDARWRYPNQEVFSLRDIEADMHAIEEAKPERLYICLDRWFFHVAVVAQARHRWVVLGEPFQMDLWRYPDGHRNLRETYMFLHNLYERFEAQMCIESLVLHWPAYRRLVGGYTCPKVVIAPYCRRLEADDNWADDVRDIYHRFPIARTYRKRYGEWFIRAQVKLATAVSPDEAVRPL